MENLRPLREAAGLTTVQLGRQLGVSHVAVCSWEKGTKFPAAAKLPTIASILGCTIDDLFASKAG